MKRARDSSVESMRSSDVIGDDVQPAPVKLTAKEKAYETIIASLQKRIIQVQSDLTAALKRAGCIPDPAAEETIRNLRDENDKLRGKLKQMESKMNTEVDKARTEIIKLKEQLAARDNQIRVLVKENADLVSTNEALEHKIVTVVQESDLQTTLRQRLRENYDNLLREFQRASERGDAFVQKIYSLQGELERAESTKRELVDEINRLSNSNSNQPVRMPISHPIDEQQEEVDYG